MRASALAVIVSALLASAACDIDEGDDWIPAVSIDNRTFYDLTLHFNGLDVHFSNSWFVPEKGAANIDPKLFEGDDATWFYGTIHWWAETVGHPPGLQPPCGDSFCNIADGTISVVEGVTTFVVVEEQ